MENNAFLALLEGGVDTGRSESADKVGVGGTGSEAGVNDT